MELHPSTPEFWSLIEQLLTNANFRDEDAILRATARATIAAHDAGELPADPHLHSMLKQIEDALRGRTTAR